MIPFVNSFVSCRDLYERGRQLLFGWGTLVLDGRWFNLAIIDVRARSNRSAPLTIARTASKFAWNPGTR